MALTPRLPGDSAQPADIDGSNAWTAETLALVDEIRLSSPETGTPVALSDVDITADGFAGAFTSNTLGYRTGTVITEASFAFSSATVTDSSSVHALRVDIAKSTYTVPVTHHMLDGTGLKIGILSDSFNVLERVRIKLNRIRNS